MSDTNLSVYLPANATVFSDAESLANALAEEIVAMANQAISETGVFRLITAGGSTPNRCYQLLAAMPNNASDWHQWHIYMGDERVLPAGDQERNSQALLDNWLQGSQIPAQNWHFIEVEKGVENAAYDYACQVFNIDEFDLALVGMGEDGHTASLFPGRNETDSVLPINCTPADDKGFNCAPVIIEQNSPKPPAMRISLNYISFSKAKKLLKVVTGASKKHALESWLCDKKPLPIALLKAQQTKLYLDQAAIA